MVLDEATAHLDSESESAVQLALSNALVGRTSLVIAHRLATVRDADQILVVDSGRIVERGTHDELLAAGGSYCGPEPHPAARRPGGRGRGRSARSPEPVGQASISSVPRSRIACAERVAIARNISSPRSVGSPYAAPTIVMSGPWSIDEAVVVAALLEGVAGDAVVQQRRVVQPR